jgi:acetolactate synthase-1/2/3 large subunit
MIGAEILTQAMSASGTSVVFSLSGNQIMPIYDACLEPGIRIVHVRHEGAAVFMADAWAQLAQAETGADTTAAGFGVALVTAGPGFANALGALYSAQMAESPVILISGDSPVNQDGRRAFQELSQTAASAPFVKKAIRVTDVAKIVDAWQQCVDIATANRPGPVHLSVPFDVLLSAGDSTSPPAASVARRSANTAPHPSGRITDVPHLGEVIDALAGAKKPVIVTGPAMTASRMPERIKLLKEATGVPVIAMESPRGLADPSLGKVGRVLQLADCVLLLGKLPDFTVAFASTEKLSANTLIVVDADAASLSQSMDVIDRVPCLALQVNPVALADGLCKQYRRLQEHKPWLEEASALLNAPVPTIDVATTASGNDTGASTRTLTPAQIGHCVQAAIDRCEHAVLVCDGGEFGQWAQACVKTDKRVINGCSGAIGGSVPQAIAAKIAHPDSVVFCMLGDGTVGFHLAELETSIREQAPIIVIIGNDSRWNAEYQIQLRDYGADRLHSCELGTDIRYDTAAEGLGCTGAMVTTEAELSQALTAAIESSLVNESSRRHNTEHNAGHNTGHNTGQGSGNRTGRTTCINVSMVGWPAPVFG